VPLRHWFRDELKDLLCDTVLSARALARGYFEPAQLRRMIDGHLSEKVDHSTRLWNLLLLELWHHEFIDASPVDVSSAII